MNNEQNFRKFCPTRPVLPHTPCFAPYALKGQKLLAQGIALGIVAVSKAPCKGKSFVNYLIFKSFCPYRATGLRP